MASRRTSLRTEDETIAQYVQKLSPNNSWSSMDDETVKRAQNYFRLMKHHAQELSSLKPSHELGFVTACCLAFDSLGQHLSKENAIKAAGVTAKVFNAFKEFAAQLLKVDSTVSLKDVAIRLGMETCIPNATQLLAEFKNTFGHMYEGVPDDQAIAVALYVTAQKMHESNRKRDLIVISKLKGAGFNLLADQMWPLYKQTDAGKDKKDAATERNPKKRRKGAPSSDKEVSSDQPESSVTDREQNVNAKNLADEDYPALRIKILQKAFADLQQNNPSKYKSFVQKYKVELSDDFFN